MVMMLMITIVTMRKTEATVLGTVGEVKLQFAKSFSRLIWIFFGVAVELMLPLTTKLFFTEKALNLFFLSVVITIF